MKKFEHPIYKGAFAYKRSDSKYAFLSVNGIRRSSGIVWSDNAKPQIIDALTDFYFEIYEPKKDDYTLYDALKLYFSEIQLSILPQTFERYKKTFKRLFPYDMSLNDIIAVKENLIENYNKEYSDKAVITRNKTLQSVKTFFDYCLQNGFVNKNPINKSMIPKRVISEIKIYTDKQLNDILNECIKRNNLKLYNIVILAAHTGLRQAELLNLEWSDISEKSINVRKGKGSKQRIIPLKPFPKAIQALKDLRVLNPNKPIHYYSCESLRNSYNRIKKSVGIFDLNFHSLRKYAIEKMRNLGIEIEYRALIAGHSEDVEKNYYLKSIDADYYEEYFKKIGIN